MKATFFFTVLLACACMTAAFPAAAQDIPRPIIRLTTCNWQPYSGVNLTNYGFASELLTTIFNRLGYSVSIDILPWKRAMVMTEKGIYDVLYNAYNSEDREQKYGVSKPYINSQTYLCGMKHSSISFNILEDLKPYKIGVVAGYVNSEEFDRARFLDIDEAPSDLHNLKKLINGRVDLIVIDKYVAVYHIKTSPFLMAGVESFSFLDPPIKIQPVHAMFSKNVTGYKIRLTNFNSELDTIIKEGIYKEILDKYNFD